MGQKTHPYGFRLGVIKPWRSNWYAEKDFSELLKEDLMLRRYVRQRLQRAGVSQINIERQPKRVTVEVHTARPGIAIGRRGADQRPAVQRGEREHKGKAPHGRGARV